MKAFSVVNIRRWAVSLGCAGMVAAAANAGSDISGSDRAVGVVYRGDPGARAVCMAIVGDNVSQLRRALNRAGDSAAVQKQYVAQTFNCNDQSLRQFALSQNASEVSGYLDRHYVYPRGIVTIEQVGALVD